ncbi:MAG: preprotein translocase subunit SecE [Terracidiphilus sp.]|jgi:preprotein translocase subunit SecE
MASKALMASGADRLDKKIINGIAGQWTEFTQFLSDVRSEMRKVVAPSWKEVKSTTTVVIIAVGIFGLFFFVVDTIFQYGLHALLGKLGGF